MLKKKITWLFKRHPLLYQMRFRLLSENSTTSMIDNFNYNSNNSQDSIPELFVKINSRIFDNKEEIDDLEKVKKICLWLNENIKGGPGLSESSDKALEMMLNGEGGVCSDFAQIFNNFCVLNHIKVREWGMTRIPFDKSYGGHSFNEIYIKNLKRWVLIDVYYCTFFHNEEKGFLSVVELISRLKRGQVFRPLYFSCTDKKIIKSIENNYFNSNNTAFLIYNYSNAVYDQSLKKWKPVIPIFLIHFILYLRKKSYRYLFPFDDYKHIFK